MQGETLNSVLGVNVLGHISGEFGIGEGVRANLRSLSAVNVPYTIQDCKVEWHHNSDDTYTDFSQENPYPINLIHVNPDIFQRHVLNNVSPNYFQNRYNIGFWAWELPSLPIEHAAFRFFDEIWAPSSFSADAIAAASPIPVIKIAHSIDLSQPSLSRADLGLPQNRFIFLYTFDCFGIFERKNPLGVVEAFIQAFDSSQTDLLLVIKVSNSEYFPDKQRILQRLTEQYPSVLVIDRHLTRAEINALIYHCNCYVSLHRSEGFGLAMAEAMFYGKPVIATGYSGNLEFMNVSNSFLVNYRLVGTTEGVTKVSRRQTG